MLSQASMYFEINMIRKILDYFHSTESWVDASLMNHDLLFLMDKLRGSLPSGCKIKVHRGYGKSNYAKSQHPHGKAVDFHVVGCTFLDAEYHIKNFLAKKNLANEVGVGLYPDWHNPGFHIDIRGQRARWAMLWQNGSQVMYSYEDGFKYAQDKFTV